ncbi:hypothetical protein RHSIM_Rhsim07G0127200 [Rhododendron simsii]|uniref:Uncharacterized protein n=1 Tax=Rhododendron simsii TaxID=118357 RepID=A0A834GSZ0_RHOSS|nr:hypothetical protein RHSIM_Rhsim07G0127200 [Rhododendron simsii]
MSNHHHRMKFVDVDIDAKIIGWDTMIRIQSSEKNHPAIRLLSVLKELDLNARGKPCQQFGCCKRLDEGKMRGGNPNSDEDYP